MASEERKLAESVPPCYTGATRPAMIFGVTYGCGITLVCVYGVLFIIGIQLGELLGAGFMTGVAAILWLICREVQREDPELFNVWWKAIKLWVLTLSPNRRLWNGMKRYEP